MRWVKTCVKVLGIGLLLLGGLFYTFLGVLPFLFDYPYCNHCPNSGPANFWELLLVASHEGEGWYLHAGVILLFFFALACLQFKKKKNR